jgi:putative oxidoreductase
MLRDLALLAARVALGEALASHGAQKAFGWFGGPGPSGAAATFAELGFRPGERFATLAAYNEIVSGQLIALGFGGPLGPALLIANMIVAAESVHRKHGFYALDGGSEVAFLYGTAGLLLASDDYGRLSFDHLLGLGRALRHPLLAGLALVGAVAGATLTLSARERGGAGPASPTFRGHNSPLS